MFTRARVPGRGHLEDRRQSFWNDALSLLIPAGIKGSRSCSRLCFRVSAPETGTEKERPADSARSSYDAKELAASQTAQLRIWNAHHLDPPQPAMLAPKATHQTLRDFLSWSFKICFIVNCVCVCMCVYFAHVHVSAGAHRGQRHQRPLARELQTVVSCPTARAVSPEPSQAPGSTSDIM